MKTIGMLGGMSWQSTLSYYQALNQGVNTHLGGHHCAKICLVSVDFAQIESLQRQGEWDKTAAILSDAAISIEAGGADFLLICSNTMHKVAAQVQSKISIPVIHIADATAQQLVSDGLTKVGLLGTRFTMEQDFYKRRLVDRFGVEVIVPTLEERKVVHNVIYDELCQGVFNPDSKQLYLDIVNNLVAQGAQAVILGCTEIALLISQLDMDIPLYDTTAIHAAHAVELALSES